MAVSILDNGELNFYQTYDDGSDSNPLSYSGQIGGLAKTPLGPNYAASKQYVDDSSAGIDPHEAVEFVSYATAMPTGSEAYYTDQGALSATLSTDAATPTRMLFVNLERKEYSLGANGDQAYVIDGQDNPTLTLKRGLTYKFYNPVSASHPFYIQKTAGGYDDGNLVTVADGVTRSDDGATVTFVVPLNAPDTLYYVCQHHATMNGTINIIDSDNIVNDANVPASGVSSTHANNGVWEVYYDGMSESAKYRRPFDWGGDDLVENEWHTPDALPSINIYGYGKLASVSDSDVTAVVQAATDDVSVEVDDATGIEVGMAVAGANVAEGTTVEAIDATTITLSRIPTGTIAQNTSLTFSIVASGYFTNGSDSFLLASDGGANSTLYTFEDGLELYGKTWGSIVKNKPDAVQGTQWTRAGVGKGAYLAVCCGWGHPMTGPGRGTAFVLQKEVSAAGGDQRLVLFRSANLDWNAVDERSIRIDADTQKLELKENNSLITDVGQTIAELNQEAYQRFNTLKEEDGFQPVHMSSGFVEYLNAKIENLLSGSDLTNLNGDLVLSKVNGTTILQGKLMIGSIGVGEYDIATPAVQAAADELADASEGSLLDQLAAFDATARQAEISEGGSLYADYNNQSTDIKSAADTLASALAGSFLDNLAKQPIGDRSDFLAGKKNTGKAVICAENVAEEVDLFPTSEGKINIGTTCDTLEVGKYVSDGPDNTKEINLKSDLVTCTGSVNTGDLSCGTVSCTGTFAINDNNGENVRETFKISKQTGSVEIKPAALDGATNYLSIADDVDGIRFRVNGNGYVSAKKVTVTSDIRLKRDIAIEDGSSCLSQLAQLDCLSYNFDEDPEHRLRGVSAQDVREVLPELVTEDEATGTLSVDYAGLAAVLVGGINSLHERMAAAGL